MILGVDPGLTGGIAMLSNDGLWLEPMPRQENGNLDAQELVRLLAGTHVQCAYVEKPFAMAKASAVSGLQFGKTVGLIHGILAAFHYPLVEITPQEWQRRMYRDCPAGILKKDRSVWAFNRIFPGISATEPGKKNLHMGMVEAALIAEYGKRIKGG